MPSTGLVPNVGEARMLKLVVNATTDGGAENPVLRLYKNDVTPASTMTLSDYTEATFTGYSAVTLSSANWTVSSTGSPVYAEYSSGVSFTCTATTSENIYGCYLSGAATSTLLWSERFTAAPYAITYTGDILTVRPKLLLRQEEEMAYVDVILTPTDIMGLYTTPVVLVPHQHGYATMPQSVVISKSSGGTAYTIGSATDIDFRITNSTGAKFASSLVPADWLNHTDTIAGRLSCPGSCSSPIYPLVGVGPPVGGNSFYEADLVVTMSGGNVSGGDIPVGIRVTYSYIQVPLPGL